MKNIEIISHILFELTLAQKLMFQPCRLSWPTSTPNQIRFVSQKSDNNLQRKEKAAFEGFFNPLLAVRRVPNPKDYNTNLYFFQKLHLQKSTAGACIERKLKISKEIKQT